MRCDLCHDSDGKPETLRLTGKCHTAAPLLARLDGDVLILACYVPDCGREVARFAVAEASESLRAELNRAHQQHDDVCHQAADLAASHGRLLAKAGRVLLFRNKDGSPCDGFLFREALDELQAAIAAAPNAAKEASRGS